MEHWELNIIDKNEMIGFRHTGRGEALHTHDFIEIEYVILGEVEQCINGEKFSGKQGDYFIIFPGDAHSFKVAADTDLVNLIFYSEVFNEVFMDGEILQYKNGLKSHIELPSSEYKNLMGLLDAMENEIQHKKNNYIFIIKKYLHIILAILMRNSKGEKERKADMSEILDYIDKNILDISVAKLSSEFGYNKAYFSQRFKSNMGIALVEYLNRRKIIEAVNLIKVEKMSIDTVSQMLGYSNKTFFYKIFKRYTGLLPGDIKRS